MKNQVRKSVAANVIGAVALLAGSCLMAQNRSTEVVKVPFAFHVQQTTLPAGTYTVGEANALGVLDIHNVTTRQHIFFETKPVGGEPGGTPKLVFNHYTAGYFLSQVWLPERAPCNIGRGKLEKEMSKAPGVVASITIGMERR